VRDVPYFIGGGIIYLVLLFTCGYLTFTKRHYVLFVLGIFIPLLWLIGAVLRPADARAT
jgi:hypothetical protein